VLGLVTCVPEMGVGLIAADESLPGIRRIKVPADRPDQWPKGSWQPIPLGELQRQLDRAAAQRGRPSPFIERADYSATLADGELQGAHLRWHTVRPDSFLSLLTVGAMNLNVSQLIWSDSESKAGPFTVTPISAVWGTTPEGTTGIVVDRKTGRLAGQWSLVGRNWLPARNSI
jgi:hypothetical protein